MSTKPKLVSSSYGILMCKFDKLQAEKNGKNPSSKKKQQTTEVTIKKTEIISVQQQNHTTTTEKSGTLCSSSSSRAIKERERSPYKTYDSGPLYEESNDTNIDLEDEPDRSKLDYYCRICDSHMNSLNMWGAHIAGKRHFKNKKNLPVQGRRKAVKGEISNCAIHDNLREIRNEPVVALSKKKKHSEERSDSQVESKEDEPVWKNHHSSYRKHKHDQEDHHASKKQKIVSNTDATAKDKFRLPTSSAVSRKPLTSSAVVQKKMYQRKSPLAVSSKSRLPLVLSLDSSDNSSGTNSPEKPASAGATPIPLQAPAVPYGPQPPPSNLAGDTLNIILDEIDGCSREVKLQIMKKVCDFSIESDAEEKKINDAVKALNNSLLQYKVLKIKELPRDMQQKIAAQLLADDETSTSDISEYESGRSSRAGHPIPPGIFAFPNAVPMF